MKQLNLKIKFVFLAMLVFTCAAQSQIINGAFKREGLVKRKPMPLTTVKESDVFWSKTLWRIIDLREKANQVFYYPLEREGQNGVKSLINILLDGIENGQITAYDARLDDDFKTPMTYPQVKESFGAVEKKRTVRNFSTGEMEERVTTAEIRTEEVKQLLIKEEWFFDKRNSRLDVRIIGICPIREYYRDEDVNQENVQRSKLFWVYFPETTELLAQALAINSKNASTGLSFYDMFIKRTFQSYIVKESSIYNRSINQYKQGQEAMQESQNIENEIFNFEQDLWEY